MLKIQILLNYAVISENVISKAVEVNWFPFAYILANLITNSIHAWSTKDYRLAGMYTIRWQPTHHFFNYSFSVCDRNVILLLNLIQFSILDIKYF